MALNEDTLVQQTTADYLRDALGWRSEYAFNTEVMGTDGTFGRKSEREVVLPRLLKEKLAELNPGLPEVAYQDALRQIVEAVAGQSLMAVNREKYALLREGVKVEFRLPDGRLDARTLRVFDFDTPENNDFLAVRELWVQGSLYRRRPDLVGFVNGLPLLFIECKNVHKKLRAAYDQNLKDYLDTIPQLFHHNAFLLLANGTEAKIGALGGKFEHFHNWKRLEEDEPGVVDMETLLKGVCSKRNLLDLFENFILFDEAGDRTVKIVARNHQFLGVNRALKAVDQRQQNLGKLGVFWHTQGSGKSYSMLFFTRKVHRRLSGSYTFLVLTDRDDLEGQIYKTYVGCGVVSEKEDSRAHSGSHLKGLLTQHKGYVFSLIQKFNEEVLPGSPYSRREDIIVISDEAHRSQYGTLALNLRNALPGASYIGFTGTPLMKGDEITRQVFGEYVSTYDFQRAVEDGATVPLYYDARGDKLRVATDDLNERIAARLAEFEYELADDPDAQRRLEQALGKDYHVITSSERLDRIAKDFVEHYAQGWESGKAMFVCIDKVTCVRMYELIEKHWQAHIQQLQKEKFALDVQDLAQRERQLKWMGETKFAVVVSEEQGEVERFRKWDLDITPHRKLMKQGWEIPGEAKRLDMESAFKQADHPFRVAIVCAMWLTGFDVPTLGTLYLDKPLKAHTLMQAIARANRVAEGKTNGLIVDYCGILKNLRKALAEFARRNGESDDDKEPGVIDPAQPEENLLLRLDESLAAVSGFLAERGAPLDAILTATGFARNAAIAAAKEAVNDSDETRKRFEVMARDVFARFKACVHQADVNSRRAAMDAVKIVYLSLQEDVEKADISHILRALHDEVDAAVATAAPVNTQGEKPALYDISKIDFEKLLEEFQRSKRKKTTVQNLKSAIEARLAKLLAMNPARKDLQARYEEIVAEYNREKDRATIEASFQQLLMLTKDLSAEEERAFELGLDEESLALFDLLRKPALEKAEIDRIKKVATGLLERLKAQLAAISDWQTKEASRDAVRLIIHDYLYDDSTGLPVESYDEEEVETISSEVYQHVWRAYPQLPSPIYTGFGI